MFKKTIVPLDGNPGSDAILNAAGALCKANGGRMVLLTVLDPDEIKAGHVTKEPKASPEGNDRGYAGPAASYSGPVTPGTGRTGWDVNMKTSEGGNRPTAASVTEALLYLADLAKRLSENGVEATTKVTHGDPVDELLHTIRAEDADSVAVTTRRQSTFARAFKGSVTDEIIKESPVPVIAMHASDEVEFNSISTPEPVIVPVDGTELSETAISPALEIAEALQSEILFVRAVQLPTGASVAPEAAPGAMQPPMYRDAWPDLSAEADQYLEKLTAHADAKGVKARGESVFGMQGDASILSLTSQYQNAIVVMATHGRTGLERAVMGSTADEVLRNSDAPVLIVRNSAIEDDED